MKVIVFGATGSVGKLAVGEFLRGGHRVTAFARRAKELELEHPKLVKHPGDVSNEDAVREAMADHDAVVITLGAGMARRSRVRSQGTLKIIRAMHENGVRRLICQSTLGAHDSRGNLNAFWKYLMFGVLLPKVLRDHEHQEDLVRASGLDWTIVRPSAFTDEPSQGGYRVDVPPQERNLRLTISRADVAGFLSRELIDGAFMGRAVAISQ